MSALDTGLIPARLPDSGLPDWKDHHGAKHGLLAHYLAEWMPKLCQTFPRTVLIDAFASAGRYQGDRKGSPLVMLDAFLEHSARVNFLRAPHFIFIEEKKKFARHLKAEVEAYPNLHGAQVDIIHGTYWDAWPRVIDWLCQQYGRPLPTFALIDPRGYTQTPFAHIEGYKKRLPQSTEVMVYLPVFFMARFAATGQVDNALTVQYGDVNWDEALKDEATLAETSDALGEVFASGLRRHFQEVTSFRVEPKYRNAYQLLFGTDNDAGLRAMKRAYWKVDAIGGQGYSYEPPPPPPSPQGALFDADPVPEENSPARRNSDELIRQLRHRFSGEEFTIEQAEAFTLRSTRFLDKGQLRPWALEPLEREDKLERIGWPAGKAKTPGKYGAGVRLRLR